MVIWNNLGLVIASLSKKVPLPISMADVETMATIWPLALLKILAYLPSFLREIRKWSWLMTALEGNDNSFASFGLLITYALLYTVTFNHISFSHTCRQGNSIAHNLARHARHVNSLAVWMEDVTPHLNDILLVDYGQFPLFNIIRIFFYIKNKK